MGAGEDEMAGRGSVRISTLVWRNAFALGLVAVMVALGGCYLLRRDPEIPPPTGARASQGDYSDSVRVTWEQVDGASRYEVQRAPEQGGTYTAVGTTSETSYEDTDVELGQGYWYRVRAIVAGERGMWSDATMGYPGEPEDAPEAPTGVRATAGDHTDKVVVSWDSAEGATTYEVYRLDDGEDAYVKITDTSDTTYDDPVAAGSGYWYRIRACSEAGCSRLSARAWGFASLGPGADEAPARPRWVEATEGEYDDRIRVTWSASAGATYYEVYRADDDDNPLTLLGGDGDYERIGEADAPEYDDFDVNACDDYWYRVKACNEVGCSDLSRADDGVRGTPMEGVSPPGGLTASYRTYANRIELSWNEVPGAVEYELRYTPNGDEETITVDGTTYAHEYEHANGNGVPAAEKEYEYRVRAVGVDACGHTDWSLAETGVRSGVPAVPDLTDIETVANGNDDEQTHSVTLTWTWTWKPAESPNPVDDFVIFRRRGAAGFSEHATADAEAAATDENGDKYLKADLDYEPANEDDDPVEVEYTFTWTEQITVEEETSFSYRLRARADFDDPDHVVEEARSSASNSRSVTLSGP